MFFFTLIPPALAAPPLPATSANYAQRPEVRAFIAELAADKDFDARALRRLFAQARRQPRVVAAMSRPMTADLDLEALAPAERAGIVRVQPDGRVDFTHPLFGSALYSSLTEATRRKLHRELAAHLDAATTSLGKYTEVTVDGTQFQRTSNTLTDVIPGVTLNVKHFPMMRGLKPAF